MHLGLCESGLITNKYNKEIHGLVISVFPSGPVGPKQIIFNDDKKKLNDCVLNGSHTFPGTSLFFFNIYLRCFKISSEGAGYRYRIEL